MASFTVHPGGRSTPPPPPTTPPPPVPPLTEAEIAEAQRALAYHLKRNPHLQPFIKGICQLDGRAESQGDAVLTLLRGRWRDDGAFAAIVGRWPELRLRQRRALGALADCGSDPEVPAHATIIRGLEDLLATVTPTTCVEVAGWISHYAVTVAAHRSTDKRALHVTAITTALQQLTDEELARLAPLVMAVATRGHRRAQRVHLAVMRFLRHICDGDDWAKFGISIIRALQSPRNLENSQVSDGASRSDVLSATCRERHL